MTALLYYSISSKLTDDEIKEIDKEISKNQELLKSLPSNSKLKVQKVLANGMLVFQLSQPLLFTVVLPLPPSVERLSQDKILSDKNSSPQIAPFIEPKIHKTILTDKRIEDLNIIVNKLENGSITLDEAILKLRAGVNPSPLIKILFRIVLVWMMEKNAAPTEAFTRPSFGHSNKVEPTPRIAPKLQQNPVDRNNPGQGSCKSSSHPSMDKLANSLSPEYSSILTIIRLKNSKN